MIETHTSRTAIPTKPFDEWMEETAPLIYACAKLQRMHLENHMAVKQADAKPWSDEEMETQRAKIERLKAQ